MTESKMPLRLPARQAESHKGDYGRALLICGSRGMSGAAAMVGMACLRGGAGLVRLAVPDACLETVASFDPSYITVPLPCDEQGRLTFQAKDPIDELAAQSNGLACGPGIGQSPQVTQFVEWLHTSIAAPIVFDADGLNALAKRDRSLAGAAGPRVLTPHPGEFARLIGEKLSVEEAQRRAVELAKQHDVVMLLKGHRTLITDGKETAYNTTGNPGMATGGCGDVLTGLIAAFLCQGLSPFDAARLAAHAHGRAGDIAADDLGQTAMIASDLIDFLPEALKEIGP